MRAAKVAVLSVCLLAGAGAFPAPAAGAGRGASKGPSKNEAEGRRHARKANQLADVNKCKAAIPEYTKAIRLLKDPTLFFNRAECYRRTSEATKAVADYRKFLALLPSAPNRSQVESQIAALDKKSSGARTTIALVPSPPIARVPPPAPVPAAPPPPPPPEPPPPPPEPTPAPVVEEHHPVAPLVAEEEAVPAAPSLPRAPAPVETPAPMALDTKAPPATRAADTSSGSSYWWIWVVGAVVLVGAGAGTYYAIKQGSTDVPPSALGNYKF